MRICHQNESCLSCLHPPLSYEGRREQGRQLSFWWKTLNLIGHYGIFFLGPHPTESGGTKVGLPIDNKRTRLNSKEPEAWDAVLYKVGGYTTILEVQIGSKAPVGIWTCRVETAYRRSPQQASLFQWTGPVYVIFNPFDRGKFFTR